MRYNYTSLEKLAGKDIWICAYYKPDLMKKAARNLRPLHVLVEASPVLKLLKINKKGQETKTSYHFKSDDRFFDTEQAATAYYNNKVIETVEGFKEEADRILKETLIQ